MIIQLRSDGNIIVVAEMADDFFWGGGIFVCSIRTMIDDSISHVFRPVDEKKKELTINICYFLSKRLFLQSPPLSAQVKWMILAY